MNWNTPNLFPPTENNIRARDRDKIFGFVYSLIAYQFTVDRHGLTALAMTRLVKNRSEQNLSLRGVSGSGRRGNPLHAMDAFG
ncbi:hypothetical protein [Candidatus Seribacter sulfatis]|uniref:hypothetical protein n=1 Tax=Candidatus Seribacter sulfatis TaxID=3381756 RepID=UPI003899E159